MNLTCLYYVAKDYKAIYHLKPEPNTFYAAGCLKNTSYQFSDEATVRTFLFNEYDRTSKFSLIDFKTVEKK
jgi:hypothetical protein